MNPDYTYDQWRKDFADTALEEVEEYRTLDEQFTDNFTSACNDVFDGDYAAARAKFASALSVAIALGATRAEQACKTYLELFNALGVR